MWCAIAVLWLSSRPYSGITGDARFYMVEALRALNPAPFANDMYFMFGSQGSFSFFPKLYLPLVQTFGIGATGLGFTIVAQIFWLFALISLVRSILSRRYLWLSLACAIALPNTYAVDMFFSYGEPFVTPRLFAEAFTMLAMALLQSRPAWTLVLLVFAAALHPLMALPGLAAAFVYFALARPRVWILAFPGMASAIMLGWLGIQPFDNLFHKIDADWMSIIKVRAPQCLLQYWSHASHIQVIEVLTWGGIAIWVARETERQFLTAIFLTGLGGLLITFVGSDLARNAFLTELQPWRSMWLLQLVVMLYMPRIFDLLLRKSSVVSANNWKPFPLAVGATLGLILISVVFKSLREPYAVHLLIRLQLIVASALLVLFIYHSGKVKRAIKIASSFLAISLIPVAAWGWDQRTPWTKLVESPATTALGELNAIIPQRSLVYWEGSVEMPWLLLKRANYFSCDQGTGIIFHRETAMTYKHRMDSFWPLRLDNLGPSDICHGFGTRENPNRTRIGLQNACRREPHLDYLALISPIKDLPSRMWKSPVTYRDIHLVDDKLISRVTDRFYIYACTDFR